VRGGSIAVDPNMSNKVSHEVWKCLHNQIISEYTKSAKMSALARHLLLASKLGETCHLVFVSNYPSLRTEGLRWCTRGENYIL
jgi:hypothetical protein